MVDWLLKKSHRSRGHGSLSEFAGIATRDKNNWRIAHLVNAAKPMNNQKTVPSNSAAMRHIRRKINVEHDEIRLFTAHATDRRRTVHRRTHFVAFGFQFYGECLENDDVIVGDENFWHTRTGLDRFGNG